MAANKPKRVLGQGAVCCGQGCDLVGCEPSDPKPAAKTVDLTDDMTGEDK